jgi:Flp pilus assembly pilin Flp
VFMSTQSARRMTLRVAEFVRDDSGVDLVEYALLSALVGLAGLVLFNLSTRMGTAYTNWNSNAQSQWVPDSPCGC